MTTCLETALRCNELGLVPVLIYKGKKRPIGKAWQTRRYTDDELRERFTNNPNLNVGLLLGPDSGVIDIECDGQTRPTTSPSYSVARFRPRRDVLHVGATIASSSGMPG